MNRVNIQVEFLQPTLKQVLWRAGCPPHQAGAEVEKRALKAIEVLNGLSSEALYGSVFFNPGEHPEYLQNMWPDKIVSVSITSLGSTVDELLDGPAELNRFMLDSAASVAVESLMKALQSALSVSINMIPTRRVAPGYGDFPLSVQKDIVKLFPDLGIVCNESYILTPVKSMTGVTGWIPQNS